MGGRAGDLDLLDHPVARHLLTGTAPVLLAYSWLDGTPRSVPMWFHWDGTAIVLGTPERAPKIAALRLHHAALFHCDLTEQENLRLVGIVGKFQQKALNLSPWVCLQP